MDNPRARRQHSNPIQSIGIPALTFAAITCFAITAAAQSSSSTTNAQPDKERLEYEALIWEHFKELNRCAAMAELLRQPDNPLSLTDEQRVALVAIKKQQDTTNQNFHERVGADIGDREKAMLGMGWACDSLSALRKEVDTQVLDSEQRKILDDATFDLALKQQDGNVMLTLTRFYHQELGMTATQLSTLRNLNGETAKALLELKKKYEADVQAVLRQAEAKASSVFTNSQKKSINQLTQDTDAGPIFGRQD